ncbi:MAG: diguanylate cyclase [Syntrophomonas sp.]
MVIGSNSDPVSLKQASEYFRKWWLFLLIERILRSSLVFQHVVQNMHDGVLTIDYSGIITMVNPAALNILEMEKDQVLGKNFSDIFFANPENDDFNQIILDSVYDASLSHHKTCNYYTGKRLKSLFMTTSFLKVQVEGELQSIGVTVLFSDVTELQDLRDAAVAFAKIKRLNQQLERLSYLDDLTNLPNRRFFNDACKREWHRSIREQRPMALIMIDIDYFKGLNDSKGHQTGDACLIAVANTLNEALRRPYDLVTRYGGDEFIAIVPNADLAAVRALAETMRQNILNLSLVNPCSPFEKLTVSIGVTAANPSPNSSPEELFRTVDEALYRAKQGGRNQISE